MANRYWVGDGGNWSDNTNHWSASSGGAPGASLPSLGDDIFFDANSFSSASQTVSADTATGARGRNMDWSNVTNNPVLGGSNQVTIDGSITLDANMSIASTVAIEILPRGGFWGGSGTVSVITTNGVTLPYLLVQNQERAVDVSLANNFAGKINFFMYGTFSTNNYSMTGQSFAFSTANVASTFTINLGTSTITVNGSVAGPGATFFGPNTNSVGASTVLNGSLATLNINPSFATSSLSMGTRPGSTFSGHLGTVNLQSSNVTFVGRMMTETIISQLNISPNVAVTWQTLEVDSETSTDVFLLDTLSANGSAGNLILFRSNSASINRTRRVSANIATVSYVDVQDNIAAGNGIPFDDTVGGVDSGNNTNWLFGNVNILARPMYFR